MNTVIKNFLLLGLITLITATVLSSVFKVVELKTHQNKNDIVDQQLKHTTN